VLGWHIVVCRQANHRELPAEAQSGAGSRVAVWKCERLDWLDERVRAGGGISLGGNGYPNRYTVAAEQFIRRILEGPPGSRTPWLSNPPDISHERNAWKDGMDRIAAEDCRPGEWLLIEAWDAKRFERAVYKQP
jgi:hypothetical protein